MLRSVRVRAGTYRKLLARCNRLRPRAFIGFRAWRHNLLLVVKEALNNIARHAKASEVRLNIVVSQNQITVTIEDNGCGFENAPDNASSDGLRNMRQRMEEISGDFCLESRLGAGTRVVFRYSWPIRMN